MINKHNTPDAANQFRSFVQGWKDGASSKAMQPKFIEHDNKLIVAAYNAGYARGRQDLNIAAQSAAEAYDYTISVLRLMDVDHETEPAGSRSDPAAT